MGSKGKIRLTWPVTFNCITGPADHEDTMASNFSAADYLAKGGRGKKQTEAAKNFHVSYSDQLHKLKF